MAKVTKKQRAFELFLLHNGSKTNAELVTLFEAELPTAEGSARTHLSLCRKKFAEQLGLKYVTREMPTATLKKGKAMKIFTKNTSLNRGEMIQKFIKNLSMSQNSAATHCSMCSKQYDGYHSAKDIKLKK